MKMMMMLLYLKAPLACINHTAILTLERTHSFQAPAQDIKAPLVHITHIAILMLERTHSFQVLVQDMGLRVALSLSPRLHELIILI